MKTTMTGRDQKTRQRDEAIRVANTALDALRAIDEALEANADEMYARAVDRLLDAGVAQAHYEANPAEHWISLGEYRCPLFSVYVEEQVCNIKFVRQRRTLTVPITPGTPRPTTPYTVAIDDQGRAVYVVEVPTGRRPSSD